MAKLTPAQVTKLSKNPGTRSKVPTAQLAPKYRKMRAANVATKALDDPNALTAPLTPRTLGQQVTAQTNLYAAPAEQDLAGREQASVAAQQAIPSWFAQYQAALANATQTTQNAYAGAAAISQNAANSSSALDATQQQAMSQDMAQRAAVSGTTVDPNIAATAQQASASRRAGTDAQTALTGALGAHQVAYRSAQQVKGAGEETQAHIAEDRRAKGLQAEGKQLAAKKGEFASTTRQKLIDAEHTKQLENKAYGLNVQKESDTVRTAAAAAQSRAAALKETQRHNLAGETTAEKRVRLAAEKDAAQRKSRTGPYAPGGSKAGPRPTSGPGSLSPVAENKIVSQARILSGLIKSSPKKDDKGRPLSDALLRQHLLNGNNPTGKPQDPAVVDMAFDLARKGGLGDAGVSAAHAAGVHVGGHFKRVKKVKQVGTKTGTPGPEH